MEVIEGLKRTSELERRNLKEGKKGVGFRRRTRISKTQSLRGVTCLD